MSKDVSFKPWSKHKSLNFYADTDDRWCNSIALHDFDIKGIKWKEWFEFTLAIFAKHGLEPMKLGVNGGLYGKSSKYLTYKGGLRKLVKHNFQEIEGLEFVVMPDKDDYPCNYLIKVDLYPDHNNIESYMVISIDERFESYNKDFFQHLAKECHNFTKAKYGYYYHRHLTAEPDAYVTGGNIGFVSEEEYRLCSIWKYERQVYDRGVIIRQLYTTGKLRDIYRLNFISSEHLNWPIENNFTLGDWIASNPAHGELTKLSPGFWSWHVEENMIPIVRQALIPTGIIICFWSKSDMTDRLLRRIS